MLPIWLISFVAKTGITGRYQKAVAWFFAVVAVLSVLGLAALAFHNWVANGKNDAVALDRADITQEVTNRVIAADREANANAVTADAVSQDNEKELDREVSKSDGNRVDAVLQRMREQQKAGRR